MILKEINETLDNVARRVRAFQWTADQKLSNDTIAEMHVEACRTCNNWVNTLEMKAFLAKLVSVNTGLSVNADGTIESRCYLIDKIQVNLLDETLVLRLIDGSDFRPYGILSLKLNDVRDFAKWRSTWQVNKQQQ